MILLKEKAVNGNQSVEKVFQIIEVMASSKGPMRLQDISASLNLPASTVIRFLKTLIIHGYVHQNQETLKYSLSLKFCQIADLVSSQISIRDIARPYLVELSENCQESSCIATEEDGMVVYIDDVDGPDNMLKTMQRIGKRAPLHSTGVGKNLLLNYDEKQIDNHIEKHGLLCLTDYTITTKDALISELNRVKSQGYAIDNEECEIGARCIAAPIIDFSGKVTASVSISGPISRMTEEKIKEIKIFITDCANKISHHLGYKP